MDKKYKIIFGIIALILLLYSGIVIYYADRDIQNNRVNSSTCTIKPPNCSSQEDFNISSLGNNTIRIVNEITTKIK